MHVILYFLVSKTAFRLVTFVPPFPLSFDDVFLFLFSFKSWYIFDCTAESLINHQFIFPVAQSHRWSMIYSINVHWVRHIKKNQKLLFLNRQNDLLREQRGSCSFNLSFSRRKEVMFSSTTNEFNCLHFFEGNVIFIFLTRTDRFYCQIILNYSTSEQNKHHNNIFLLQSSLFPGFALYTSCWNQNSS
jgi:hypothetical protein